MLRVSEEEREGRGVGGVAGGRLSNDLFLSNIPCQIQHQGLVWAFGVVLKDLLGLVDIYGIMNECDWECVWVVDEMTSGGCTTVPWRRVLMFFFAVHRGSNI